jgi:hypothetical protein
MRALFSLLSHIGVFAVGAFLISFALLIAGVIAELIYKLGLPNNNSF